MANRPGGNNPLGRNSPLSPRYGGDSLLQVSIDLRGVQEYLKKKRTEVGKVERAANEANQALADSLASYMQQVLQEKIDAKGRPQYRGNKLIEAIADQRNRSVNAHGFTVGRLDNIPEVRQYWRGLEYGTAVHVGRFLPGYFVDGEGSPLPFVEGGRDVFAVRSRGKVQDPSRGGSNGKQRAPFRARIKHEIIGYHFQKEGYERWKRNDGTNATLIQTYAFYFKQAGIDLGLGPGAVQRSVTGFNRKPGAPHPDGVRNR